MKCKIVLILSCFVMSCFSGWTQVKKTKEKSKFYPVVVQFHSVCCGVPSDKPLTTFISAFKKQNSIVKIVAEKISPLGKEGEYYLAFPLKEMNRKQKYIFKNNIKKVVAKMKDKGNATVEENMNIFKSELPGNVKFTKISY